MPTLTIQRRQALALLFASTYAPSFAQTNNWPNIEAKAKGQTVYFNAWAGSERINAYIQWAAQELKKSHGINLEHVKITDAADMIKRVRNEKAAGKLTEGSVDLVWINGENFLTMKKEGLLFGPFAQSLPFFSLVDTKGKPTTLLDFAEPTDGLESPWGMAQLTFMADSKRLPQNPSSMAQLLELAKKNPGRITYPKLPDFTGTTFIKQIFLELNTDRSAFYKPVTSQAMQTTAGPVWAFLDQLHPHLWRKGQQFPQNPGALRQMMADGELLLAMTFNPNEAANEIAAKRLSTSVYSYQHKNGTIGNTHFVAIPFNAKAKEAAQVVANFLLSPAAQARKADIEQWGDPTVLALDKLSTSQKTAFAAKPLAGQLTQYAPTLSEPHGSWVEAIEKEWLKRYGA